MDYGRRCGLGVDGRRLPALLQRRPVWRRPQPDVEALELKMQETPPPSRHGMRMPRTSDS